MDCPTLALTTRRRYRYLWLKYVTGVRLEQHCAKCLPGTYSALVQAGQTDHAGALDERPDGVVALYLCGVAYSGWADNLHVAFRPKVGAEVEVLTPDVDLLLTNAERLPISPDWIDPSSPYAHKSAYRTCRNWQFAWWLARDLGLVPPVAAPADAGGAAGDRQQLANGLLLFDSSTSGGDSGADR